VNGLTAVSLFAGIGGIDLALERQGVTVCAAVEIDEACRSVLGRHFPKTALFSDVTEVTGDQLRAAGFVPEHGILAAGWPCTGNSIAGRRQGMADPRSGLWVHVARLLAELRPRWFLGENVPGLYSVNDGRDIAIVRSDLAQLGYWWAERILGAEYFGVPQRRNRIVFAGCLGDRAAPVQVLFEPEGSDRDPAQSRQARQSASRGTASGTGSPQTVGTLGGNGPGGGWRVGSDEAAAGQLVVPTVGTLKATDGGMDIERAAAGQLVIATPLLEVNGRSGRAASTRDGTGIGDPGAPMFTLQAGKQHGIAVTAATLQGGGRRGHRIDAEGAAGGHLIVDAPLPSREVSHALTSREGKGADSDVTSGNLVMIAHTLTSEGADASEDGTGRGIPIVPMGIPLEKGTAVRRLTPRETERLQGLPDDWTRWRDDGTEQSDSARYRQTGNSVAVPVFQWVAGRIVAVGDAMREASAA
jgi:DNA (cytosine-5)-methyltransferase 1